MEYMEDRGNYMCDGTAVDRDALSVHFTPLSLQSC